MFELYNAAYITMKLIVKWRFLKLFYRTKTDDCVSSGLTIMRTVLLCSAMNCRLQFDLHQYLRESGGNRTPDTKSKIISATFKSGYISLSVWDAFSARGRIPLICINRTFKKEQYKCILESTLVPFASQHYDSLSHFT